MNKVCFVFFFLMGLSAFAQRSVVQMPQPSLPPPQAQFYLLNPEMRFERGNSQQFENVKPLNLAVGMQGQKLGLLMEYVRYTDDTGNQTSAIDRTHQELIFWFKYGLLKYAYSDGELSLHSAVGAGAYQEEVKTTLMGISRADQGEFRFMSGVAVGGQASYKLSKFELISALDGRMLVASDFDPNPLWSLVLRFGVQFPL